MKKNNTTANNRTETKTLYRTSFTLPNGKRKFVSAKSQEELDKKVLELKLQANAGVDICDETTFGEYALLWYKAYKEPYCSATYKASILNILNNHLLPYLSGYPVRMIGQMQIQGCFGHLNGMSSSLFNKTKIVLNEILNSAVSNHLIASSPMLSAKISSKPRKREEREALTEEEEAEVLRVLRKEAMRPGANKGIVRAYYMCVFGFKFGMRRGEIAGLKESDFDLTSHDVVLRRSIIWPDNNHGQVNDRMKTDKAHRRLPIPDSVYDDVCKIVNETRRNKFILACDDGSPMSAVCVRNAWNKVEELTGYKFGKHTMRHTYCTRLYERGFLPKEVQYLMGHASPDMSLRVYAHYTQRSQYSKTSEKLRSSF